MRSWSDAEDRMLSFLDTRGTFDYTTGDDQFDTSIAKKWHDVRPREEKFTPKYGTEEVQKDLEGLKKIESAPTYEREHNPISVLAEYILAEGLGNRGWLGADTSASITSKYDDIRRGADLLVTIPNPLDEEGEDLAFVVDVTSSQNQEILRGKVRSELDRIERGERIRLKYFRGAEEPLNRYVLGIPPDQTKFLADVVLGRHQDDGTEEAVRLELFGELRHQAAEQIDYVLTHHHFPGYRETEDPLAIKIFVEEHAEELRRHLSEEMAGSVSVSYGILLHVDHEEENLLSVMGKKKGAETRSFSSRVEPVNFLQTVHFSDLRAAAYHPRPSS